MPGFGDATADFQASLYTSTDPAAIKAGLQTQLASNPAVARVISSYDQAQTNALIVGGTVKAVTGQGSQDEQEAQAAFAGAAIAGAVIGGMTVAAAAAAVAPLALIAWGGGYAIGQLIQNALGIKNRGPVACSKDDPTKYAESPGSPGWITFQDYVNSNGPPPQGWTDQGQHWSPATDGPFERWARPIIVRAFELSANCKPLPGVQTWRQFADGLLSVWNAQFPGAPKRTISEVMPGSEVIYGSDAQKTYYALRNDPIQWFLQGRGVAQVDPSDRSQVVAGELQQPWFIQVADPSPTSVKSPTSTASKVATVAVAAPFALTLGTIAYAWVMGRSVDTVFSHLWMATKIFVRHVAGEARANPLELFERQSTTVQSLLFPRGEFDARSARSWARKHGYRASKTHTTGDYVRVRQHPPDDFVQSSFRTIPFGSGGIKAVIGHLR
jgi:hypothetical protein